MDDDVRRALERGGEGLSITVVRLAALGDILRTLPPVRALRAAFPRARLRWVVDDRWAAILDGHPDIDSLERFPRRELQRIAPTPFRWATGVDPVATFVRGLRDERRRASRSIAVDFHGNLRSGLVVGLTGADVRLGYDGHQQKEGNRWFLTHRIPSEGRRESRMERNLRLVRALGAATDPLPSGGIPIARGAALDAARIVSETFPGTDRYAMLSPGASAAQAYKRPPGELLEAAARTFAEHGVPVLVVWGPGEQESASAVAERASPAARLAPETSIEVLSALLARATAFIGGDTGPLHLACAVGCPVLGLYGPTDPEVNAPWGVPFERVFPAGRAYTGIKRIDRVAGGFDGVTADDVRGAAVRLLRGLPASPRSR